MLKLQNSADRAVVENANDSQTNLGSIQRRVPRPHAITDQE
jgi:hypothetical protein